MKITDAELDRAIGAFNAVAREKFPETARWPDDYAPDEQEDMRACMRAALATQPDRYRVGFEKALEMILERTEKTWPEADDLLYDIGNMEMPDAD